MVVISRRNVKPAELNRSERGRDEREEGEVPRPGELDEEDQRGPAGDGDGRGAAQAGPREGRHREGAEHGVPDADQGGRAVEGDRTREAGERHRQHRGDEVEGSDIGVGGEEGPEVGGAGEEFHQQVGDEHHHEEAGEKQRHRHPQRRQVRAGAVTGRQPRRDGREEQERPDGENEPDQEEQESARGGAESAGLDFREGLQRVPDQEHPDPEQGPAPVPVAGDFIDDHAFRHLPRTILATTS